MSDFKGQLESQLKFIERSCAAYDAGHLEEAVRIAVSLRVLFHDTAKSTSLLRHLNSLTFQLTSSAAPFADAHAAADIPSLYLVHLKAAVPEVRCWAEPLLDTNYGVHLLDFATWWDVEVVIDLKQGHGSLTRRKLTLEAANTDGGAHVAEKLEARYKKAQEGAGISIEVDFKGGPTKKATFRDIHYASLRQIGYEVLKSPAILALAGR